MLGDELRKARLAAGLTQEQVSFASSVDRTYISELENDHKSPTLEVLFRICRAIGIRAADLVGRVEDAQVKRSAKRRG